MGHYTQFHFKARIKKDIPKYVLKLIQCNLPGKELPDGETKAFNYFINNHEFFRDERYYKVCSIILCTEYPSFYKIELAGDLNYGHDAIQLFIELILPYVYSRKKKAYLGYWRGEETNQNINIYKHKKE